MPKKIVSKITFLKAIIFKKYRHEQLVYRQQTVVHSVNRINFRSLTSKLGISLVMNAPKYIELYRKSIEWNIFSNYWVVNSCVGYSAPSTVELIRMISLDLVLLFIDYKIKVFWFLSVPRAMTFRLSIMNFNRSFPHLKKHSLIGRRQWDWSLVIQ